MNKVTHLKDKAISGVMWKFIERFLAQGITLLVSLVIARILMPDDYAVVGIVSIFFTFANVLISGGLNTALIQKVDADIKDYSSVFTVSFLMGLILYVVMFFSAPAIARMYNQDLLIPVIRVMGVALPLYAIKSIVCAYISASLQFKKFFFATLVGTLVSGIVGIGMALGGLGVWALVAQQITNTFIDTIILFFVTKLKLSFYISFYRLKSLFAYGWKIMLSSFMGVAYTQINPLFIGLKFSKSDLSFYTKGESFPSFLASSVTNTLSSVLFPFLSKYQDNKRYLLHGTRRFMCLSSFIVFPFMLGLFAVAENFVHVILTDKWLPAVYYIQIFCISGMFDIIAVGNCETIKAMGRSDIYLIIEVIKKSLYFVTLALFIFFSKSPEILAISVLVTTLIQIMVNTVPNIKLIGYKISLQIKDIFLNLISAVLMCVAVLFIGRLQINKLILLIIQIVSGIVIYVGISVITRNKNMRYIINGIKSFNASKAKESDCKEESEKVDE